MARPKKYSTTEEIDAKILLYLNTCEQRKELPNKAGLCLFLEITKETYCQYKKKEEFSDSLKRFENLTENAWVQRLGGNSPTGAIFYLKNAFREDWKDKHETELSGKDGAALVVQVINYGDNSNPPPVSAEGISVKIPSQPSEV